MNIGADASIPSRRSWITWPISCSSSRSDEADRERPAPDQRVGGDRDQHRRRGREQLQLRQQQQDRLQLRRQQQRAGGDRAEEALQPLAPALAARAGMDRLVVVLRRAPAREPAPESPNRCSAGAVITRSGYGSALLDPSASSRSSRRSSPPWELSLPRDLARRGPRAARAGRPAGRRAPATDGRCGRRPRLPRGDGIPRAPLGAVRRSVGMARGDDELRGRQGGPGSPRGRDRSPGKRSSTGSSTGRDPAARLSVHRPARARGAAGRRRDGLLVADRRGRRHPLGPRSTPSSRAGWPRRGASSTSTTTR